MSLLTALLLQAAGPLAEPAICTKVADPPAGMAAWTQPAEGGDLRIGVALKPKMADVATLHFAAAPARAPVGGTYGAILPFTVARAGTYAIALSEAAWMDVVRGADRALSSGHRHGPPCSGIRKIVDFRLAPGRYALQLIGAPRPEGIVLIVRR